MYVSLSESRPSGGLAGGRYYGGSNRVLLLFYGPYVVFFSFFPRSADDYNGLYVGVYCIDILAASVCFWEFLSLRGDARGESRLRRGSLE